MKLATSLSLVAGLLVATAPASAVEYSVSRCADLADVDNNLATVLTIDSSTFVCDEYTRFRVRNAMTLKATGPAVEFSNFSLKILGELTVEPDVVFTGVVDQVINGGVLSVAKGASATFMGTSEFIDNSIAIKQIGPFSCGEGCTRIGRGLSYIVKKGAAVHNKGLLTFEGDATFTRNVVKTDDSVERGKAGAISNTGSGSILFKGKLTMKENEAEGNYEGLGGAIYNRGEIVGDGECYFSLNTASTGGGIYQTKIGSFTFNAMATFFDNEGSDYLGGGVFNAGVMVFNAGSLFEQNSAASSGDGGSGAGIYNTAGGVITLAGPTTFKENVAYRGAAIYNNPGDVESGAPAAVTTFPTDTVFVDNRAPLCPNVNNGDDFDCPEV